MSVMLKCDVAVNYANTLGIYAVPTGTQGLFWRPRLPNGNDPTDLQWLEIERKNPLGWPRWELAVIALGDFLTGKEPTDASDTEGC